MRQYFLRRNRRLASSTNPRTYYCLFGLLATTDTRISEALNLQTKDVDWSEGVLTIHGKCSKSRLVPLHCSTLKVLSAYSARRDRLSGKESVFHFFVSRRGTRLDGGHVRRTFYHLSRRVGLRAVSSTHSSRLHDYRHYAESWNMPHRVFAKLRQAFKTAADPIRNAVPMRHSPICFQPSKKMRFPQRMERFSLLLY
jgi:integrase